MNEPTLPPGTVVAAGLSTPLAAVLVAAAALGTAAAVFVSLVMITDGGVPWMAYDRSHLMDRNPWLPWGTIAVSALLAGAMAARFVRPRAGCVVLSSSDIFVERSLSGQRAVRWEEVSSFDDDRRGYVRLFVGEAGLPPSLTVPTRDEATRTAVLDILAEHGICRAS